MDESTTGEPLGRSDSRNDAGAPIGVQGPREKPGPIGGNAPPQPSPTNPTAAATQELNLVGSFPKPASWTAKKELDQIHADKWFPSTLDFLAVAGKGSVAVANTWDFCLQIVKAPKKISRLNFFSHGTTNVIALQGEIADDGSNVMLATIPDAGWTQVLFPKAILDPFAQKWGDIGQNSGSVSLTVNGTSFTLDDVRKKFAADATIWLYLCHGASDPRLFQEVANTFQVTAKGFTKEIVYCAPTDFPTSRRHKVAVLTTAKAIDSCVNGDVDFKKLDTNTNVRTAQPQRP
jgi:hypothetical protein